MKPTKTSHAANARGLILALAGWLMAAPASGVVYTLTDLGSNSWSYSEGHGLNGVGHVVGEYESATSIYVAGFLYQNGEMADLGHLTGPPYTVAYGINDSGLVVGESDIANGTRAFLYSNGTMVDLGTLGTGGGYSSAHAINSAGEVVGVATLPDGSLMHAVLYSGGTKTDLGALGGIYSSASAINGSGVIAGESDVVNGTETNVHAFVYANGIMENLGTLGGQNSSAKGLNDAGVVVGESEIVLGGLGYLHAFIYQNGSMTDLGTLGGGTSSAAAINNLGQIVGYATDTNEIACACIWSGTNIVNLNDLISPGSAFTNLTSADAINDAGQIAGSGFRADGAYHAYLLTPLPSLQVRITNPAPNSVFVAPAAFDVGAGVTDSAAIVTNVQLLLNSNVFANLAAAPYVATVTGLAPGAYVLAAVASDTAGLSATNSIDVTVRTDSLVQIKISDLAFDGKGFSFSFPTQSGFTYQGQFSTGLEANSWLIFTNVAGDGSVVRVTDSGPAESQRFYRVMAY